MQRHHYWVVPFALAFLLAYSRTSSAAAPLDNEESAQPQARTQRSAPLFHPAEWSKEELEKYLELQFRLGYQPGNVELHKSVSGAKGIVVGMTEPFAVHVGTKVLQAEGSAADAVIASTLAQIALSAGSAVSYAGLMNAVYYDAGSGQVHSLNAGFNTVRDETDPLSIPKPPTPSGRTALVPGFMAGIQALHDRFGKLPFADLFGPAIWIAEHGVAMNHPVQGQMSQNLNALSRLPQTKAIFFKSDGKPYGVSETFKQPALAETLKKVASEGAAYMYSGEWGRRFVAAVRSDGGKLTMDDLAAYRPVWSEPMRISYRGFEVLSVGGGHQGARATLGPLKAAEAANLKQLGLFTSSADALFHLLQISKIHHALTFMTPQARAQSFPEFADVTPELQISQTVAERVIARVRNGARTNAPAEPSRDPHTSAVVLSDRLGNVATLVHSINSVSWGTTGIFVDGISIPDSARFQQEMIARVGPGARLPDPTVPLIVLKNGKPVLACGGIGAGAIILYKLVSILEFDVDLETANGQPWQANRRGEFPPELIASVRELGHEIDVNAQGTSAYWAAIRLNIQSNRFEAAVSRGLPSLIEVF